MNSQGKRHSTDGQSQDDSATEIYKEFKAVIIMPCEVNTPFK